MEEMGSELRHVWDELATEYVRPGLDALSPAHVERVFGTAFAGDLTATIRDGTREKFQLRKLLAYVVSEAAQDGGAGATTLIEAFSRRDPGEAGAAAVLETLLATYVGWHAALTKAGHLKPCSVLSDVRAAGRHLEALSSHCSGYPAFHRNFAKFRKAVGIGIGLEHLGWPEIDALPEAERRDAALALVRTAAVLLFRALETTYRFGESILRGDPCPPGFDPAARDAIRGLLEAERRSWSTTGHSQFDRRGVPFDRSGGVGIDLHGVGPWLDAGLDPRVFAVLRHHGRTSSRAPLAAKMGIYCLGSSNLMVMAFATIFAVDTGWNRQPILGLPRDPIIFRNEGTAYVAETAFVESFKVRAGHSVLGCLERKRPLSPMLLAKAEADWRSTVAAEDPSGIRDGHAVLDASTAADDGILAIMDAYGPIAEATHALDHGVHRADRYLIALRVTGGVDTKDEGMSDKCLSRVFGRKGLSFQTIRKSRLGSELGTSRSVSAVAVTAGHGTTRVTMPHYLNTPECDAMFEESVRYFQGTLEALAVAGLDASAVAMRLPGGAHDWFRRLSVLSGLAAAFGVGGPAEPVEAPVVLAFIPTADNLLDLLDLLLTRRALRAARERLERRRWVIQVMPLLAASHAIGLRLCETGLRPALVEAARRATRCLRDGSAVIPNLGGC